MKFTVELHEFRTEFLASLPKDIAEVIEVDVERHIAAGLEEQAIQVGDYIPSFELRNAVGETVDTDELLAEGPMVISFYRGSWCPYCNIQLKAYQDILPEIKELGAQLVAISPADPDDSVSLIEKHQLEYEVLSDSNNDVARKFGLAFKLGDDLMGAYKKLGLDLEDFYGKENLELPMPGTFIVNSDGLVLEAQVNYDFTKRMDPEKILEVLRETSY